MLKHKAIWSDSGVTCGSCTQKMCRFQIDLTKICIYIQANISFRNCVKCEGIWSKILRVFISKQCSILPYTCSVYHTRYYHIRLPYTFSEISDRSCNYKGVELPSGCVVPGSRSIHTFGCCFVNCRGGLKRWTISGFLVLLGWAPCQVGTRSVTKLAGLSSKSTLQPLCCILWVQGAVLASPFLCPVCSISWMGSSREEGPIPIGELDLKLICCYVCKVGDILLVEFKVGEV